MTFSFQHFFKKIAEVGIEPTYSGYEPDGQPTASLHGAARGTRTPDIFITSEAHYQLCYNGILHFLYNKSNLTYDIGGGIRTHKQRSHLILSQASVPFEYTDINGCAKSRTQTLYVIDFESTLSAYSRIHPWYP